MGNQGKTVAKAAEVIEMPWSSGWRWTPVTTITRPVVEQTRMVSMKGSSSATMPSRTGSSVVAAEWANALIVEFNSFLRETAVAQSRKRIAYLNRELDETHVIPLRQAIYRLIEVETRAIMIAETRTDYAFKVIDPAVPPNFDDPIRPKRGLLIRTTTLTGFIIAVFAAILRDFVRMLREQDGGSPAAR